MRATRTDSLAAGEIKGSLAILDVLKNAVRDRQEVPSKPITLRFDTYDLKLDRKTVTKARGRARSSRRPHNLARPIFVAAVIEALALQMAELIGGNLVDGGSLLSRDDIADIRDEMREDPDIMSAIGKLWPELSPQQILAELWTSPARLAKAAPQLDDAQRDELLQSVGPGFSAADAPPLLDELAEILASTTPPNANAHNVNGARRSPTPGRPRHPHRVCTTGSRRRDGSRDLDGVRLDRRQPTRPTPRSGQRQTTAERAAGDRTWTYGHVIVDEAQELSEMAWRMLMRRIPNRWMTLVGDTAQTGDPAGTSSWQKILEPYVAKRWKLTELTVNYRTPSEIMDVAHRVLEEIDPEQSVPPGRYATADSRRGRSRPRPKNWNRPCAVASSPSRIPVSPQ